MNFDYLLSKNIINTKESIWNKLSIECSIYNPINLGIGIADFKPPNEIIQSFNLIPFYDGLHSYCRSQGNEDLVERIARFYYSKHGIKINHFKNVVITLGAWHALFCCLKCFIDEEDEVLMFDPAFDCYQSIVDNIGGKAIGIPFKFNESDGKISLSFNKEDIIKRITTKTKIFLLNNPHNPSGKNFMEKEIEDISKICIEYNLICICDEVYDELQLNQNMFYHIASVKEMFNRTLTIKSAGKVFNITGWKIGWTIGPEFLIKNVAKMLNISNYTTSKPLQVVLAKSFKNYEKCSYRSFIDYINQQNAILTRTCQRFISMLLKKGVQVVVPEAGIFILANFKNIARKIGFNGCDSYEFILWMIKEKNICTVPLNEFYLKRQLPGYDNAFYNGLWVRICIAKNDNNIKRALEIFEKL